MRWLTVLLDVMALLLVAFSFLQVAVSHYDRACFTMLNALVIFVVNNGERKPRRAAIEVHYLPMDHAAAAENVAKGLRMAQIRKSA